MERRASTLHTCVAPTSLRRRRHLMSQLFGCSRTAAEYRTPLAMCAALRCHRESACRLLVSCRLTIHACSRSMAARVRLRLQLVAAARASARLVAVCVSTSPHVHTTRAARRRSALAAKSLATLRSPAWSRHSSAPRFHRRSAARHREMTKRIRPVASRWVAALHVPTALWQHTSDAVASNAPCAWAASVARRHSESARSCCSELPISPQ